MENLAAAAAAAWTFAAPLLEIGRVRGRAFGAGQTAGRFAGATQLITPRNRAVTMPNNDTVYASTFVDLGGGPATFTVPASPARYASLQIMDFYSNNVAVLSPRTIGEGGGRFRVVGPGATPEAGDIVSSTPWIWALARVVVDGPEDLGGALAVRDRFDVSAADPVQAPAAFAATGATALEQLTAADGLLRENPPAAVDAAWVKRFEALGLGGEVMFDPMRFDAEARTAIESGVAAARAQAMNPLASGYRSGDWLFNHPDTGVFGQDYELRAAVATFGLAAFPPAEALYLRAVAPDGGFGFDGPGPWRLSFPPDRLPAVESFWSATLYTPTPTGQYFLVDNPIDRYAIGDRTAGLRYGPDGTLDIWIARSDPGGERTANWLPAPQSGPFAIVLRAYHPRTELLEGRSPPRAIVAA